MNQPCAVELQFFKMLNRIVEPRIRAGWGSPRLAPGGLIVLETRAARTKRRSRVPLAAIRIHDHVVVSTFRGGRSRWVKDAAANSDVRYWLNGRPRSASAVVLSDQHRPRGLRDLPAAVRWLAQLLVPYTHAGWAFAVLAPREAEADEDVQED